jgi:hypothetical protein
MPETTTANAVPVTPSRRTRRRQEGQVVVLFAGAILALLALCAVVVDVAWYWTNNLRIQRAADAAALAGVVWLPGNPSQAFSVARAEAAKNGFTNGVGGVVISSSVDPNNNRRLRVTISAPVGTFFARVVGVTSWPASRDARADYVLPVPMGSPDNYYGVGYLVKPETQTLTNHRYYDESSGPRVPTTAPGTAGWSFSPVATSSLTDALANQDTRYVYTATNNAVQSWGGFNLLNGLAADEAITGINGIVVTLNNVRLSANCASSTNRVLVQLSWDGGSTWTDSTTSTRTGSFTNTSNQDYTLGSLANTTIWTATGLNWDTNSATKLATNNFLVRLTASKGCSTGSTQIQVDNLTVEVSYAVDQTYYTTQTVLINNATVDPPAGQAAITRPQKFWGAMQSQGAPSVQGDAFMAKYNVRTGTLNAVGGTDPDTYYDYTNFYNYAVEIPAGGGGTVWIYDPGFCDGTSTAGTGEYWTVGGTNGYASRQPISAFYQLYNTNQTMLDLTDDTLVTATGNTYRRLSGEDFTIFGAQGSSTNVATDCSAAAGHLGWVQIATGLAAGTYRIHTYSTDTTALADQDSSTGLNAFAFYASAASGTPKIYGIGAMEAYVRLPAGQVSEFYLAQIEAVHAGKTMVINLWDPGDTGALSASLQILQPTGSGFTPVQFDWSAIAASNSAGVSSCNGSGASGVFSVTTNTGGSSLFNGCWVTIEVPLPATYSAPNDPATGQPGWWKIRYSMGSQSGGGATDLTTWKVDIRGNPVHLVTP